MHTEHSIQISSFSDTILPPMCDGWIHILMQYIRTHTPSEAVDLHLCFIMRIPWETWKWVRSWWVMLTRAHSLEPTCTLLAAISVISGSRARDGSRAKSAKSPHFPSPLRPRAAQHAPCAPFILVLPSFALGTDAMLLRAKTPQTPLVSSQTSLAPAYLISSSAAAVQGELLGSGCCCRQHDAGRFFDFCLQGWRPWLGFHTHTCCCLACFLCLFSPRTFTECVYLQADMRNTGTSISLLFLLRLVLFLDWGRIRKDIM